MKKEIFNKWFEELLTKNNDLLQSLTDNEQERFKQELNFINNEIDKFPNEYNFADSLQFIVNSNFIGNVNKPNSIICYICKIGAGNNQ